MLMDVVSALLVAEDANQEIMIGILLRRMKRVHLVLRTVPRIAEAKRVLLEERFDLLFLQHSARDELALLELIAAAQKRALPAVLIAESDADELDERALRAGASAFLLRREVAPALLDRTIRYVLAHAAQTLEWMRLALFDATAGVASRRMFDLRIKEEFLRARRCDCRLALLLIDIDDFKPFNDAHGHLAGDDCIRRVGETLRRCVHRVSDLVARYGGEEYAAILPATDVEGAARIAERMRAEVARMPAHEGPRGVSRVTVSIGIATIVPDRSSTIEELIHDADGALYKAKRSGKNRCVRADEREGAPAEVGA